MLSNIAFYGAIETGLIYGLVAFGIYLSFRVLDFPDLTVDGSFPLGAAVAAVLISGHLGEFFVKHRTRNTQQFGCPGTIATTGDQCFFNCLGFGIGQGFSQWTHRLWHQR